MACAGAENTTLTVETADEPLLPARAETEHTADTEGRTPYPIRVGASLFPLRVPLRGPTATEMVGAFAQVQAWARRYLELEEEQHLAHAGHGAASTNGAVAAPDADIRVEWVEQSHRQLGRNRIPTAVVFRNLHALARFLGAGAVRELRRFEALLSIVHERAPELEGWALRKPFELLERADDVERLIDVTLWIRANPRPGIYLRQIPLQGVHTKFVEQHRAILSAWFDQVLPESAIDTAWTGVKGFEHRYGFRAKPELVRIRLLDPSLTIGGYTDLSVPVEEFARAAPHNAIRRILVLENDITALAMPPLRETMVVFGRGYSFESLRAAQWMNDLELHYWGDIDTHGFAILNQFRAVFPQARSLLMDRGTLLGHRQQWATEPTPTRADLPHLLAEEAALYADLRDNRWGDGVRLEQELIDYRRMLEAVNGL